MGVTIQKQTVLPKAQTALARSVKPEPKDTIKLVDDMRKDETFRLAIAVIKSLAAGASVSIESKGDNPKTEAVKNNLLAVWNKYLHTALNAVEYGRQVFEIVYARDPLASDLSFNPIAELVAVPFELSKINIDNESGSIKSIEVGTGQSKETLTPSEFWLCAIDATITEPYGRSRYRGAPWKVRQERKQLEKQETIWYDRYSMGFTIARAPEVLEDNAVIGQGDIGNTDVSGQPINPMKAFEDQLDTVKSGGIVTLSSKKYEGGDYEWTIDQLPELKDGTTLANRRMRLDCAALRSMGIPDRAVMQDDTTGSRATAQVHVEVLNDVVEEIFRQVVESFQEYVIGRLCRINDIPERLTMTYTAIGDKADDRISAIITSALQSNTPSPFLTEGVVDIVELLESQGIPLGPNPDEAIERVRQKLAAAAAPAPSFGGQFSLLDEAFKEVGQQMRQLSLGESCCGT